MADVPNIPILYWSPSRAAHPDACETAPGLVIDTASKHGLVLGSADDSWQVLSGLPDDAARLVAEPSGSCDATIRVLRRWATTCRSHEYADTPFMQGVRTGNLNAADAFDEAANELASLSAAAPPVPLDPAALLRLAASGRREYAASGGPHTEVLEQEASTFEQAARIVSGDWKSLRGALPSWRWGEIPGAVEVNDPLAQDDGPELTEEARRTGRCSQCGKGFAEWACGPTHAVAAGLWFGGQQQAQAVEDLRRERDAAVERSGAAKDGDADELLLVRDAERVSGRPTIGHSRLPAGTVLRRLASEPSFAAVQAAYPGVTAEQLGVLSALAEELLREPVDGRPPELDLIRLRAMERQYVDAWQRLIGLPHLDAIPEALRDNTDGPVTLTAVVDLLCEHLGPNTVGAPATSMADPDALRCATCGRTGTTPDLRGEGRTFVTLDRCAACSAAPDAARRPVVDELRSLSRAAANSQVHLGMVGASEQQERHYHRAQVDALRDIELRLNALIDRVRELSSAKHDESLPEPDDHEVVDDEHGQVAVPVWTLHRLPVPGGAVAAWPDGLDFDGGLIDRGAGMDIVVEDCCRVLAAVAAVHAATAPVRHPESVEGVREPGTEPHRTTGPEPFASRLVDGRAAAGIDLPHSMPTDVQAWTEVPG